MESNTQGSEGYGEVTQGSVTRLVYFLGNLRELMLKDLPMQEGAVLDDLWDLGPQSSFLDIGSGDGAVLAEVATYCFSVSTLALQRVERMDRVGPVDGKGEGQLSPNPPVPGRLLGVDVSDELVQRSVSRQLSVGFPRPRC